MGTSQSSRTPEDTRGGLNELRDELAVAGVANPLWFEVPKSKMAPKRVREALDGGAEIVFVWGGDGMVQRCVDAMAGSDAALAIIPAGTANLFASNLEIPKDVRAAVAVGLEGHRRRLDVGQINGERFVVMAGAGLDALMIRDADGALKKRLGRAAYIFTGAKNISLPTRTVRVFASTVTSGSTATRAACSSPTWARCSGRCLPFRRPGPTTVSSTSASSPPRACGNGREPSRALLPVTRRRLRSCKPHEGDPSTFASPTRCRMSSTAAIARRPGVCASRFTTRR